MNGKTLHINYDPVHQGTAQTTIAFYPEESSLFGIKAANMHATSPNDEQKRFYITDTIVAKLPSVQSFLEDEKQTGHKVFILEAGEKHKTAENLLRISEVALKGNLNRSSVFTGIGGGVVCDLSAFAASIFKRGAHLELIPTTLLAMTDAAIGGKTGCDFGVYKNMLGSFYPAETVHIAPDFIQSLNEREFRSGLAEVLKTAMLYDKDVFKTLKENKIAVCNKEKQAVANIIQACVQAKARVVEKDLNEHGIRMELNFGHTFAHALESIAGFGTVSHGEAVAWGIGRALELSLNLQLCGQAYKKEVFSLLENYGWCTCALHPALHKINKAGEALLKAMKQDKKNSSSTIRVVLQSGIGQTLIKEVNDDDILAVL